MACNSILRTDRIRCRRVARGVSVAYYRFPRIVESDNDNVICLAPCEVLVESTQESVHCYEEKFGDGKDVLPSKSPFLP
jgi:hypothetical protein